MRPAGCFSLAICGIIVRLGSLLVPRGLRQNWISEWQGELWHRREFLRCSRQWNAREAWAVFLDCRAAIKDAAWMLASHEPVRAKVYQCARSPLTPVLAFVGALLLIVLCTGGAPATRALIAGQGFGGELVYIWLHPNISGGDRGLPVEVVWAWAEHSKLLTGAAAFVPGRGAVEVDNSTWKPLVIRTEPPLFKLLRTKAALGAIPQGSGALLTDSLWRSKFHADPRVIGREIKKGRETFRITGVLPRDFHFLTREPVLYIVDRWITGNRMMVVARIRPGVSEKRLDHELIRIAENSCYYFFESQLRYSWLSSQRWAPLKMFGLGVIASGLLMAGIYLRSWGGKRAWWRAGYFALKCTAALTFVLVAGLEWSRSQSAILFGSRDPASGPFLLWLYILAAMGTWWWVIADQRARCRECLRLLCFPVRIGCPGQVLLDWSGTEFLCAQGHGVLHVPDLETSWDEPGKHWISLDESWKDLFAAVD